MDRDLLLRELSDFLRIPSVSTLPVHNQDCRRAADWVAAELRRLGCHDVEFLGSDTHPVVWAWARGTRAPTLLIYGHTTCSRPIHSAVDDAAVRPTVRDGRLTRGAATTGPGLLLKAIDAAGKPAVNFRFLIEGEKNTARRCSSIFLAQPQRRRRYRARCGYVVRRTGLADGLYDAARSVHAEITVRTSKTDLHSGEYGGAAPNHTRCQLLGRLKGEDGRSTFGFYAPVKRPSKAELAAWKKLPFNEKNFLNTRVQAKGLVGLKQYSVLERLWALPTFEIHGITGGFTGEGAKTVIPAVATAKISMRLVPNQRLKTVERQLAATVKRLAPTHVSASVRFLHGAAPAPIKVDRPPFRCSIRHSRR
jgi:acetylornithine deacetylase/succinyl-diaminopimelate desuccinylase-like protein